MPFDVGKALTAKTADLPNWAWLGIIVVGGGVGYYFVNRQNQANAAQTSTATSTDTTGATTDTVANLPAMPDYSTSGIPTSPVYVISAPSPPTNVPPTGTTPPTTTPPPVQTVTVRSRQTSGPNANYDKTHTGVPIHAGTSGQTPTLRYAPYGSSVQISGGPIVGGSNTGSGEGGSDEWYPVVGGGYISAWDIVGMGGGMVRREVRH